MLQLFSTKLSHKLLKLVFRLSYIDFILEPVKIRQESSEYNIRSQSMKFVHVNKRFKNRLIYSVRSPGPEYPFSTFTKNVLFVKYDLYQDGIDSISPKKVISKKNMSWSIISNWPCTPLFFRIRHTITNLAIRYKIYAFYSKGEASNAD